MVISFSRLNVLALCVCLQIAPAYSQCDSVQRNDSPFSVALGARRLDSVPPFHSKDFEMSSRGGARVEVYLCDGSMMYGDLLWVRDSALSVYVYRDYSFSPLHPVSSGPHGFNFREIRTVVVKGRSKILQGVFIGFVGGMLAGSIMTRIVERNTPAAALVGPTELGGMGLMMGGTIGYLSSGDDLEIRKFDVVNLKFLRMACRNPDNGPR
jgi:hypothetical protein